MKNDINKSLHDGMAEMSDFARQRQEAMLPQLLDSMLHIHRVRRIRRRAILATAPFALIAVAIMLWLYVSRPSTPSPGDIARQPIGIQEQSSPIQAPTPSFTIDIQIVQTTPAITTRYLASAESTAIVIDDDSLMTALAMLDRPTGLVRSEGQTWLTADVLDPPLAAPDAGS